MLWSRRLVHAAVDKSVEGGENVDLASSEGVVGEDGVGNATAVLASWGDLSARVLLEKVLDLSVGQIGASGAEESDRTSCVWARHGSTREDSISGVRSVVGGVDVGAWGRNVGLDGSVDGWASGAEGRESVGVGG